MSKFFDLFPSLSAPVVKGIPGIDLNTPLAGNAPTGEVGIELEIEGSGLPGAVNSVTVCSETGARWTAKQDGSLRGGLEYVVNRPCAAASVEKMTGDLLRYIQHDVGATVRLSNRCSTHVHVNISDFKINQITSLFAVWACIEPAVINYCGLERTTNHFCLSILDSTSTVDAWESFLESGQFGVFPEGIKYAALNIRPLFDFGSAEFRCGRAPHDAKQVGDWARFLWGVRQYAAKIEDPSTFPALLREIKPTGVLREICVDTGLEHLYDEIVKDFPLIDQRGFRSFSEVRGLCHKFPWTEWLPEINKAYVINPFARTSTAARRSASIAPTRIEGLERIVRPTTASMWTTSSP